LAQVPSGLRVSRTPRTRRLSPVAFALAARARGGGRGAMAVKVVNKFIISRRVEFFCTGVGADILSKQLEQLRLLLASDRAHNAFEIASGPDALPDCGKEELPCEEEPPVPCDGGLRPVDESAGIVGAGPLHPPPTPLGWQSPRRTCRARAPSTRASSPPLRVGAFGALSGDCCSGEDREEEAEEWKWACSAPPAAQSARPGWGTPPRCARKARPRRGRRECALWPTAPETWVGQVPAPLMKPAATADAARESVSDGAGTAGVALNEGDACGKPTATGDAAPVSVYDGSGIAVITSNMCGVSEKPTASGDAVESVSDGAGIAVVTSNMCEGFEKPTAKGDAAECVADGVGADVITSNMCDVAEKPTANGDACESVSDGAGIAVVTSNMCEGFEKPTAKGDAAECVADGVGADVITSNMCDVAEKPTANGDACESVSDGAGIAVVTSNMCIGSQNPTANGDAAESVSDGAGTACVTPHLCDACEKPTATSDAAVSVSDGASHDDGELSSEDDVLGRAAQLSSMMHTNKQLREDLLKCREAMEPSAFAAKLQEFHDIDEQLESFMKALLK